MEDWRSVQEEECVWKERALFQERAMRFIGRMRAVQGDRQFSQWKGSVVDSVVGAFLTQNVSDHLSSSAYMALAARFPRPKPPAALSGMEKGPKPWPTAAGPSHVQRSLFQAACFLPPIAARMPSIGSTVINVCDAMEPSLPTDTGAAEAESSRAENPADTPTTSPVALACLMDGLPLARSDTTIPTVSAAASEHRMGQAQGPCIGGPPAAVREATISQVVDEAAPECLSVLEVVHGDVSAAASTAGRVDPAGGLRRGVGIQRAPQFADGVDWGAVVAADVAEIAQLIKERGMHDTLAGRIKAFLMRVAAEEGSIDLERLKDVPTSEARSHLLSFKGLGIKSTECILLLTLHRLAFPVDTNVGRICVRLGWVPLESLNEEQQLHLLDQYPIQASIQGYLWRRLCMLDQRTLYELHYQMITFGKVFCTKRLPNCKACPMQDECLHFASAKVAKTASETLALPAPPPCSPAREAPFQQPPFFAAPLPPLAPPLESTHPSLTKPAALGPMTQNRLSLWAPLGEPTCTSDRVDVSYDARHAEGKDICSRSTDAESAESPPLDKDAALLREVTAILLSQEGGPRMPAVQRPKLKVRKRANQSTCLSASSPPGVVLPDLEEPPGEISQDSALSAEVLAIFQGAQNWEGGGGHQQAATNWRDFLSHQDWQTPSENGVSAGGCHGGEELRSSDSLPPSTGCLGTSHGAPDVSSNVLDSGGQVSGAEVELWTGGGSAAEGGSEQVGEMQLVATTPSGAGGGQLVAANKIANFWALPPKNPRRFRTIRHAFELPSSSPLVKHLGALEPDDPSPYLAVVRPQGEALFERCPTPQEVARGSKRGARWGGLEGLTLSEPPELDDCSCSTCSCPKDGMLQVTLLVPCRTAMQGSFPLNGTYFQINEVFADHASSQVPTAASAALFSGLRRSPVYFGVAATSIFRGMSMEEVSTVFQEGYVCVRAFEQVTRAPKPLSQKLHATLAAARALRRDLPISSLAQECTPPDVVQGSPGGTPKGTAQNTAVGDDETGAAISTLMLSRQPGSTEDQSNIGVSGEPLSV